MRRLFIAEKPKMGQEIAKCLSGRQERGDGFVQVGDDIVSWCAGHLLAQADPEAYDEKYKSWRLEDLPIIPSKWKLIVPSDRNKKQVKVIKDLLAKVDVVVNAGDPGREGQMIVDELLQFLNNKKPVKRILLNALDETTIKRELAAIQDNSVFRNLYLAGIARSQADWLVGMNMTRAYTIKGRQTGYKGVLSVGRVQSPTLAIVVRRDLEIESFIPKDYFVPFATFRMQSGEFSATWHAPKEHEYSWIDKEGRITDKSKADSIKSKIDGKTGKIAEFIEKPGKEPPPLPFSLSDLQIYANKKWGYTAQETLDAAQALYEAKITSYPRTDCSYLPENQHKDAQDIISAINSNMSELGMAVRGADPTLKSRAWNDSKLGEHHAIIPTREGKGIDSLGKTERDLYEAIATRYLAQFYVECEYRTANVTVVVEEETFKASGKIITKNGWRDIMSKDSEGEGEQPADDAEDQMFPPMKSGDTAICSKADIKPKTTKAPPRHTEASLLEAMRTAHQFIENPEMKKRLKDAKGIGTEATRANIIETIVKRGMVSRKAKNIISSVAGRALVAALPTRMTDPVMTALWENALDSIAQGKSSFDDFMSKQSQWVTTLVGQAATAEIKGLPSEEATGPSGNGSERKKPSNLEGHGEPCPKCNEGTMQTRAINKGKFAGKSFLGCSNYPKCQHSVWPK